MRVSLKGIHKVRKRLSDGSTTTYYYAWRGGPRLVQQPNSPAFVAEYAAAVDTRKTPQAGTLFSLVAEYRSSADFNRLSAATRHSYGAYLKLIEADFGDMPVAALADKRVRGEFKAWRDKMVATPRKADLAWTVLARVMSFAKDRGRIETNPCERGGRLHSGSRADNIWNDDQLTKLLTVANEQMTLAVTLALWTGQRQGDLLQLRWSDYDGNSIRLTQSKTGRPVAVSVAKPLKSLLEGTKRKSLYVLTSKSGEAFTSDGFRTSWRKLCKRAGVSGLTFHDLRGTAVTKLARAGATVQEIASITGHSLKDVSTILDRHYLGDRASLATSGIKKLERKEKRTKTVNQL
ncbi:MAG: tyrosine-type recombinase/integrase [Xanthobacteraceae bacterium]|nr:tyrosine-type recombinase/integrase [Xanthobacteraceae bacterium]MBX3533481.1 tyrosine-type recombinase/integrase [Xanthobacteraceae bacterium]MCW5676421.1 tyrosine-type recombinase/integrase [Xanthobacteraceae bacterium]